MTKSMSKQQTTEGADVLFENIQIYSLKKKDYINGLLGKLVHRRKKLRDIQIVEPMKIYLHMGNIEVVKVDFAFKGKISIKGDLWTKGKKSIFDDEKQGFRKYHVQLQEHWARRIGRSDQKVREIDWSERNQKERRFDHNRGEE